MDFKFDAQAYPYASRRRVVYGRRGMVCTSQPLAAQAGLAMLKQGGNAIDAAIATAICLTIVEPVSNSLGSDAFALVWPKGENKLYGLNGSGYAPGLMTPEAVAAKGHKEVMPTTGWSSVTVPGAPSAWAELHKKFGKLPFEKLFEPAIDYARNGYPVSPVISTIWKDAAARFEGLEQEAVHQEFFKVLLPAGKGPEPGQLMKFPDHAKTLEELAATYCESYYRGTIAKKIAAFSEVTEGFIREADLAAYKAEWVEPIHTNYRGYEVWEIPPNGHGITALMALNILRGFEFNEKECGETYHKQIEAMKLAYCDAMKYVADPRYMKTKLEDMLSERYAAERRALISEEALDPFPGDPYCGGTVYLCAADEEGNMISYIQSHFKDLGAGVVVPGTGISMNCRANGFKLDPESDDYLVPGKKPYHTIIPGFLTKDGQAVGPFGVMGGYMQPQGHVQVMANTIDFGMNPQAALDAPRWQWEIGKRIQLEESVPQEIIEDLRRRGHELVLGVPYHKFGRGQIIWRNEEGILCGATEPRTDGTVAVW